MADNVVRRRMMVDNQIRPSDVTKFPIIENTITITKLTFIAKDQIISDPIQYPKNSNLSFC